MILLENMSRIPHACAKPTDAHSIVAVHGLNGDPFRTWTTEGSEKMWLKDPSLLPSNLKNSRILTYGYNTMVTAVFSKTSSDRILQHAHTLVAQLVADREVSLVGRMESAMVTEIEQIAGRYDAPADHLRLPLTQWHCRESSKTNRIIQEPKADYLQALAYSAASPSSMYIRSASRRSGFCSWGLLMTVVA
jgi:hypothetical protein